MVDEIANAAFFVGLMLSLPREYGDIATRMEFDNAKSNFFRAARHGLDAQFNWIDGQNLPASSLILDHLLPLARAGLRDSQVDLRDVDKYLGIIEERVRTRQTGAAWIAKSLAVMPDSPSKDVTQRRLTSAMLAKQKQGQPIHQWPVIEISGGDEDWERGYRTVGQFMSTDLFTVRPDDLIDLAASVMDWRHIRHVPVEDEDGRLAGLVTHRSLLRLMSNGARQNGATPTTVREIMVANPITISPSTPSLEAIRIMREHHIGCLPVIEDHHLVGIVTSFDFLEASAKIFQQQLTTNEEAKAHTA
jgi:CBS domain-containing protein